MPGLTSNHDPGRRVAPARLRRDAHARLRFSIIGALFAAPPAKGELHGALRALAAKPWRDPATGLDVRFGVSTLQRWYYAARRSSDPVAALTDRLRAHVGCFPSLSAQAQATLILQYRQHPGWTIQLHYDNLRVAMAQSASPGNPGTVPTLPSYPTVRRFLRSRGMVRQRALRRATDGAVAARDRLEQLEVRSFEMDHVGALWHLDFHHGSRRVLTVRGQWVKPMLMCVMDDRSRLVCHLQWYLDESAHSLVHALSQALMKRGLPRSLMTDNGAAMLAAETTAGLATLGILHQTTLPYSPYQNAKQEAFWARVESRLMAMLEGEVQLSLELLNQATQAWVEQEYRKRSANPSFPGALKLRTSCLGNQRTGRDEHGSTTCAAMHGAGGGLSRLRHEGQGLGRSQRRASGNAGQLVCALPAVAGQA